MNAIAMAPPENLIDGVDVEAVARAVCGCPGVEALHGGFPGEVATYLPGRRITGVRVGSHTIEIQVRAAWNVPVPEVAVGVQAAVLPLAGGRKVDVIVGDLGDPPPAAARTDTPHEGAQVAPGLGWPVAPAEQSKAPHGGSGRPGAEGRDR